MTLMTPGMAKVLTRLTRPDDEGDLTSETSELVCEGFACWAGDVRTNRRVVNLLVQYLLLTDVSDEGGIERYVISDTGRAALRRPELLGEISRALANRVAFTVRDDRVVALDVPSDA